MVDFLGTNPGRNEPVTSGTDLTPSEIVTSIVPALIGMAIVGIIAVLMLI